MRETTIKNIGDINDSKNTTLLKMWEVFIPAGKRPVARHQHLNFEIMMVNSGSGIYMTETAQYPIYSGDVFVFCSNEWHCITEVGNENLSITNLQFDPIFIQNNQSELADIFSSVNVNFCFHHNSAFHNRIEAQKAVPLVELLRSIRAELLLRDQEYILSVKSHLYLLLVKLLRNYNYMDNTNQLSSEQLSNVNRALSYIDLHFTEKIALQELSSLAGLTPNYFCSLFKQASGMTLWDYISAKRINKAIQLLTSEDSFANIIDIAEKCGYNNTANFNKTFRKLTGMTPREYRTSKHLMIS